MGAASVAKTTKASQVWITDPSGLHGARPSNSQRDADQSVPTAPFDRPLGRDQAGAGAVLRHDHLVNVEIVLDEIASAEGPTITQAAGQHGDQFRAVMLVIWNASPSWRAKQKGPPFGVTRPVHSGRPKPGGQPAAASEAGVRRSSGKPNVAQKFGRRRRCGTLRGRIISCARQEAFQRVVRHRRGGRKFHPPAFGMLKRTDPRATALAAVHMRRHCDSRRHGQVAGGEIQQPGRRGVTASAQLQALKRNRAGWSADA